MIGQEILPLMLIEEVPDDLPTKPIAMEEMARIRPGTKQEAIEAKADMMVNRLARLTEWMTWAALRGTLTINRDRLDEDKVIDYRIPASNKPVTSIPWSDHENATPERDLEVFASRVNEPRVFMNSATAMHAEEFVRAHHEIVIYDNGFVDEFTREPCPYIEDGDVFVIGTRDPVGHMGNFPIEMKPPPPSPIYGPHIYRRWVSKTNFLVVTASRLPIITQPDQVVHARVLV